MSDEKGQRAAAQGADRAGEDYRNPVPRRDEDRVLVTDPDSPSAERWQC